MARRPRHDGIDVWHHAMNRGIARRTIFESDADRRFFLSLLAREVRAGRLEVHGFCLMLTHFHLLVKSLRGELSEAMRRIQNRYSRHFNRTRRRDGPLFRGRFLSRDIDSLKYRRNVLIYIHDNPLDAGIAALPWDYSWSSAHLIASGRAPRWLSTDWVETELEARGGGGSRSERLAAAFPSRIEEDFRRWVEKQLSERFRDKEGEVEDVALKHAGSPRVVRWTVRKAQLADGTRPWRPVCAPKAVARLAERMERRVGPLPGRFARKAKDAWLCLKAGLLRMLAGCTHREIGLRHQRHSSTVCRDLQDHARLFGEDGDYAALFSKVASAALGAAPC